MKSSIIKRVATVIPAFFLFLFTSYSQTIEKKTEPSPWGIKLSGFIRNDAMVDSRQTVNAVEGDIVLFPADINKDANGVDKNAGASFNMLPITTRVTANLTGPDAFGAKTSAILEGEFFGFGNGTTQSNLFGLRHAYIKLDWPRTQLAFGQYWHPLYNPECAPSQLGFSGGMPFVPFNRSPQIRLTQKLNNQLSFILAAITERDYESVIPGNTAGTAVFLPTGTAAGVTSPDGMRNSVMPDLNAQLIYKSSAVLVGVALDYKSLRPALAVSTGTNAGYVSTKRVNSLAFEVYGKIIAKDFMVKAEYVSGQNMTDLVMLGGYIAYGTVPDINYKPTSVSSYWVDICGTGKKVMPGIFAGYTNNSGAVDMGGIASYGRGLSVSTRGINYVMRIAPRIEFISGKFKFGAEMDVTSAAYGTSSTNADVAGSTDVVTNVRGLFVTTFSF